jgi:hypothetical protein
VAKKPGARQRKAQDRKRKKRETAKRSAKTQALSSRSPQAQMRRAGASPLRECFILEGWEESRIPTVVISRDGPDGIAIGVFLVDLDCLGVKNCIAVPDLSWDDYQAMRKRFEEDAPLVRCDPAFARKLVEAGVSFAAELGFRPEKDYRLACEIFGDIDAAACEVEIGCGDGGRPRYLEGPDDDADAILAQLTARVGADGFDYIVDGGGLGDGEAYFDPLLEHVLGLAVEPEWAKENDAEVPEADRPWYRLRRCEGRLTAKLLGEAIDRFDPALLQEAWGEFTLWDDDRSEPSQWRDLWSVFVDWYAYSWRPSLEELKLRDAEYGIEDAEWGPWPELPLALEYLDANASRLDDYEQRFLEEMSGQPRSYYEVLRVLVGRGLVLKDLFTNREVEVRERSLTGVVQPGGVLFSRVVEQGGVAVVCGCAPVVELPSAIREKIGKYRDAMLAALGRVDGDALHEYDAELRELYFASVEQLLGRQEPVRAPGSRDFGG